jgi:hypothetical protein
MSQGRSPGSRLEASRFTGLPFPDDESSSGFGAGLPFTVAGPRRICTGFPNLAIFY